MKFRVSQTQKKLFLFGEMTTKKNFFPTEKGTWLLKRNVSSVLAINQTVCLYYYVLYII